MGRPKAVAGTKKITYNTRLKPDHVKWLRKHDNAAAVLHDLIEKAINGDPCKKEVE